MNKKKEVLKVHTRKISPPSEKVPRWATHVTAYTVSDHRRRIYANSESEMYDKLYEFYYGSSETSIGTLSTIYPDWKKSRVATCARIDTVYRNDLDWKKYYLDEPLSESLITTPIEKLTRADIKEWACSLIKKHNMTRKQYGNAQTILKQIFIYLIDKELIETDPTLNLKLSSKLFRKTPKKSAKTQIFYKDEIDRICSECYSRAEESGDETWLAIPLFFLTGIRIGELLGLGHDDFDKEEAAIHIHRSLCMEMDLLEDGSFSSRRYTIQDHLKQNAEPRDIKVPSSVFEIEKKIRLLQLKKGSLDNYLFHVVTPHAVTDKLYRLCEDLGIVRRSPHKCRKTYISNLFNKGIDPDFVREQAGHKCLQTTLDNYVYGTTREEEMVKKLEDILVG